MKNIDNVIKPAYNNEKLSDTWSENSYDKYFTSEDTWQWHDFPNFNKKNNPFISPNMMVDGSILEIGCAAGAAYRKLYNSKVIDESSDYTGIDISSKGISYCKENNPHGNWEQVDLTQHTFENRYDYGFERIAVHHMEDPLEIFNKILNQINISFTCGFVSCLNGDTISDLSLSRYRHAAGNLVYFNIINLFQVCEIMLSHGFNEIDIVYGSEHEEVFSDSLAHQYVAPEINIEKRMVGRTHLIATKSNSTINVNLCNNRKTSSLIYQTMRKIYRNTNIAGEHLLLIEDRIEKFNNRTYGVLYKSAYQPD